MSIEVTITDADDDAVDLVLEFTLDGTTFLTPSLTGSPSLTGLAADADGETFTFTWDTVLDGVGLSAVASGVQVRVTPSDGTDTGAVELSLAFDIDNTGAIATAPSVTTVTPTGGPLGTVITVEGFNLGNDVSAIVASVAGEILPVVSVSTDLSTVTLDGSPSLLELLTTPEVVSGTLELTVNGTVVATGVSFTASARLRSVAPGGVLEDGLVHPITIRGTGLDRGSVSVVFTSGGVDTVVAPTSVSATEVVADFPLSLVPASGGSLVDVAIEHDGGRSNAVQIAHSDSALTLVIPPVVAALEIASIELEPRVAAGLIPITVSIFDSGLDAAGLEMSFSVDGGAPQPCTEASVAPLDANLAVSDLGSGRPHVFWWDAGLDLGVDLLTSVRVHATATVPGVATGGRFDSAPFWTRGEATGAIVENFDDNLLEDAAVTTADWNDVLGSSFGLPGALVGIADSLPEAPWGDGSDGVFAPTSNVTLTTDGVDPVFGGMDGVYRFSSFDLLPGLTVTAVGSNPLDIRVAGTVNLQGNVDVSGADGTDANLFATGSGGAAGPGASAGGVGGTMVGGVVTDGGVADRGGRGGVTSTSVEPSAVGGGGGGGGHASAGADGETSTAMGSGRGGVGGIPRGFAAHRIFFAGVGGGGGGGRADNSGGTIGSGGGGGGGGGALRIVAQDTVTIGGEIHADGGHGGNGFTGGAGGAGSGGTVVVATAADIVFIDGVELTAEGGNGGSQAPQGGDGAPGRIVLAAATPIELPGAGSGGGALDFSGASPGVGDSGFSSGTFSAGSFDPGTGSLGAFAPTSDVELMTDGIDVNFGGVDGVFDFTTIDVPAGVTVTATGSNPLVLRATGDVTIDGTIVVAGDDAPRVPFLPLGSAGVAGLGGPGGGDGGDGGFYTGTPPTGVPTAGTAGTLPINATTGAAGGGANTVFFDDDVSMAGGGGGGGHGANGDAGTDGSGSIGTPGGTAGELLGVNDFRDPSDPDAIVLIGGSGGGGGGGNADGQFGVGTGGGGGGGGGGVLHLVSGGSLSLSATASLDADGGDGAPCQLDPAGKGGGGAGGGILVQADSLDIDGASITALGGVSAAGMGTPGGNGADGRIRFEQTATTGGGITGLIEPDPTTFDFEPVLRVSVAQSIPVAAENDFGFPIPAIRPAAPVTVPATQTAPANVAILWGVWQASDAGPVKFSGFTADPAALPPGDFVQFKVFMESSIIPSIPASLDSIETTLGQ